MKADPTRDIPLQTSKPEEWMNWHEGLKSNYGKKVANQLFLKAWHTRGNSNDNNSLRTYLKKQGINLSSGMLASIDDAAYSYVDTLGDFFKVGKYATFAIVGIVVVGSGMLIWNVAKNPIGAAGAAAKLETGGLIK